MFDGLVETKLTIESLLRANKFPEATRKELEWDLWIIKGLLDKNLTYGSLEKARARRIACQLGPDHTYECIDN